MRKVLRCLLLTLMTLCFSLPALGAAEAATVALLPLINNVAGDELAAQIYYKEAINTLKSKKGFVLVENDALTAAIEKAGVGNAVPGQAALAQIARDGDVDIVFALQLDELSKRERQLPGERIAKLNLQGKAVAYNRLNGAFYEHKLKSDKEIDVSLTARWDWKHEEFGRAVRQEIDRALRAK